MTSNDISPESPKDKLTKVCPYLGLLDDSQTALSFPSAGNLCNHSKPLASPSLEYQRSVCLKGRRHTQCPVFTRSELAPLPPDIIGSPANKLFSGKPIEKRALLMILLGCIVLILVVIGLLWFLNGHGGNNAALSGKPGNSTPTSDELLLGPATLSTTDIPITPNVDISTDTPVAILSETEAPLTSLTPTLFGNPPVPIHTQVPCGSPNTWVVYIVRPGDSLYRLSQVSGITIAVLQQANCLGTTTTLHTGQLLYVPRTVVIAPSATLPIIFIPTFTPSDTPVIIPPSDTPTEPPIDTATEISIATDVPADTPTSP